MTSPTADPDSLMQAGVSLYQRGQFEEIAAYSRKALKVRPAHLGALNLLAVRLRFDASRAASSCSDVRQINSAKV
ncbi:MAG TPA: hypothetical protein VMO26_21040 [Vicinamibacterales bacterium]|nr:hypothetical protein [Vicinamibacterales bacterium]